MEKERRYNKRSGEKEKRVSRPTKITEDSGVTVMAFLSFGTTSGESQTIHFPPALFFFFEAEISSHTSSPLLRSVSVHSGSAS